MGQRFSKTSDIVQIHHSNIVQNLVYVLLWAASAKELHFIILMTQEIVVIISLHQLKQKWTHHTKMLSLVNVVLFFFFSVNAFVLEIFEHYLASVCDGIY